MENYFVILEIPACDFPAAGVREHSIRLQSFIAGEVSKGNVKLVTSRRDTGVSEELRAYNKKARHFSWYVLLNIKLNGREIKNNFSLFRKAAHKLKSGGSPFIIEQTKDFRLLTFEA